MKTCSGSRIFRYFLNTGKECSEFYTIKNEKIMGMAKTETIKVSPTQTTALLMHWNSQVVRVLVLHLDRNQGQEHKQRSKRKGRIRGTQWNRNLIVP
jgi:hypothetical protein